MSNVEGHKRDQYSQEWDPSQILDQSPEEASMSNTVLQESIAKVSNARENDRAGQENLETVKIKSIHLDSESEEEIINDGPDRRGSNPIYIHWSASMRAIEEKKFKCD